MVAANVIISVTISFAVRLAFWLAVAPSAPVGSLPWPLSRRRSSSRWCRSSGSRSAGRSAWCSPAPRRALHGPLGGRARSVGHRGRGLRHACSTSSSAPRRARSQAENRATEAQLRLLQAQIEPHFLFNTLANVVSLIDADPPRAKAMLESFIDYLRASLSGLRPWRAHARRRARPGRRLPAADEDAHGRPPAVPIEVPTRCAAWPLPPLRLQPLVENAIVHGLEPKVDGGACASRARRDGRALVVRSPTTAPGCRAGRAAHRAARGSGTALANLRERLRADLRQRARSPRHRAAEPHGVRAPLSLPVAP